MLSQGAPACMQCAQQHSRLTYTALVFPCVWLEQAAIRSFVFQGIRWSTSEFLVRCINCVHWTMRVKCAVYAGRTSSNACSDSAYDPAGSRSTLYSQRVLDKLGPQPLPRLLHLILAAFLSCLATHERRYILALSVPRSRQSC